MTERVSVGVTGAAGYIGSRVTRNLLVDNHDVVPIDNFSESNIDAINDVQIMEIDVRDRDALRDTFADVDIVLHLAAITGILDCNDTPELAFNVNVSGTENIAWLCREWEIPLVFPCSMAMIGDPDTFPITADNPRDPQNIYGLTKTMSESDIHTLATDMFPAHVYMKSNLYGHHQVNGTTVGKRTVINVFVEQALDRTPLTVHTPGTQSRDFIHVKDVARAYLLSIEHLLDADGTGAITFPLASGDARSVIEIAELVQQITEEELGYRPPIEKVENPRAKETGTKNFTVDTSAAQRHIGFDAHHTIEQTIRDMIT